MLTLLLCALAVSATTLRDAAEAPRTTMDVLIDCLRSNQIDAWMIETTDETLVMIRDDPDHPGKNETANECMLNALHSESNGSCQRLSLHVHFSDQHGNDDFQKALAETTRPRAAGTVWQRIVQCLVGKVKREWAGIHMYSSSSNSFDTRGRPSTRSSDNSHKEPLRVPPVSLTVRIPRETKAEFRAIKNLINRGYISADQATLQALENDRARRHRFG